MARSMWKGNISFGMVTIPVSLHAATEGYGLSFHQLHKKCDTRIQEHRYCPHCDEDVEWEDIVKGYEYEKGKYVEVTKEDLAKLPLPSKHTIDVGSFVKIDEIDPVYFDSVYYIEVEQGSDKAFKLLYQAMESKGLAGIATIAFRNKERLCAVRPMQNTLILQTLLYEDEIRDNDAGKVGKAAPSPQEKKMAEMLVATMMSKFAPGKYKDHYDIALKKLVQAKLKGTELKEEEPEEATNVTDLMEALKRSLERKSKNSAKAKVVKAKPTKAKPTKSKSSKTAAAHKTATRKPAGRAKKSA